MTFSSRRGVFVFLLCVSFLVALAYWAGTYLAEMHLGEAFPIPVEQLTPPSTRSVRSTFEGDFPDEPSPKADVAENGDDIPEGGGNEAQPK